MYVNEDGVHEQLFQLLVKFNSDWVSKSPSTSDILESDIL